MELTLKDIKRIWLTDEAIHIETKNGKTAEEPFANYTRLKNATTKQRKEYETSDFGLYWPKLDEDLSFDGFFKTEECKTTLGQLVSGIGEINISALARRVGIAQPLMAAYISGKRKPSIKQQQKIMDGLHTLGKELQALKFT